MKRVTCVLVLVAVALALPAAVWGATPPPGEWLGRYVNTPDAAYKWEQGPVQQLDFGTVTDLVETTQVWHGITWRHLVRVITPKEVAYPGWMLLFITGGEGEPSPAKQQEDDGIGLAFARAMRAPVAILYTVPNQPLFGNLVEDAIISLTYENYIKDGDITWPLLFPMAKSAVRTMDTIQAWAKRAGRPINNFIVTGASKRGWTTWMTACTGDKRVKAIAPMVIDTVNFPAQFELSLVEWGKYSEQVVDYSEKGILNTNSQRSKDVWASVDPYTFRRQLTLPKLMILGANDPYWPTGALNMYWDGLVGPKYVIYAPNSGHGLDDRQRVFNTIGAYFRTIAGGGTMPQMSWTRKIDNGQLTLTITAPAATGARAWVVKAANTDFRPQKWESAPMTGANGTYTFTITKPADQNVAVFGEADFSQGGQPFTLSTQQAILGPPEVMKAANK